MRVVCIDGLKKGQPITKHLEGQSHPITTDEQIFEGEKYTVVAECVHEGETWYQLEERPAIIAYNAKRFAPTSDIDETEMERNYNTEKVFS